MWPGRGRIVESVSPLHLTSSPSSPLRASFQDGNLLGKYAEKSEMPLHTGSPLCPKPPPHPSAGVGIACRVGGGGGQGRGAFHLAGRRKGKRGWNMWEAPWCQARRLAPKSPGINPRLPPTPPTPQDANEQWGGTQPPMWAPPKLRPPKGRLFTFTTPAQLTASRACKNRAGPPVRPASVRGAEEAASQPPTVQAPFVKGGTLHRRHRQCWAGIVGAKTGALSPHSLTGLLPASFR